MKRFIQNLMYNIRNFIPSLLNRIAGGKFHPRWYGCVEIGPHRFEEPVEKPEQDYLKRTIKRNKILRHARWVGPIPYLVRTSDELRGTHWCLVNGWPFAIWLDEVEGSGRDPLNFIRITVYFFEWAILDRYLYMHP